MGVGDADQSEPAEATDAGDAGDTSEGGDAGEGTDAGEAMLWTGAGAGAGAGGVAALATLGTDGVETTAGLGAETTVIEESVTLMVTPVRSRTLPSRPVMAPPGSTSPCVVRRSIALAATVAPPAITPRPSAPVTPYAIHFRLFMADVYIGYLRQKLGSDRIETVRGVGYRLV